MKKWIYNSLIILFAVIFVVSAAALGHYYYDAYQQQNRYAALADLRPADSRPAPTQPPADDTTSPTTPAPKTVAVTHPKTGETMHILESFAQLYQLNSDIVGWLTVPGTVIDYPVMQTPDDPEYYLKRNFDKEKNKRGCLFAQAEADVFQPSDNVVIYGHHMRDDTMFGELDVYRDAQFREENPYIYFDTLTEMRTYEVMAVFLTTASAGKGFAYHAFIDGDEAEFDAFVAQCQDLSLYDTGVCAQYGDKLLCLSTCEYSQTNGRLVVVAKRIV